MYMQAHCLGKMQSMAHRQVSKCGWMASSLTTYPMEQKFGLCAVTFSTVGDSIGLCVFGDSELIAMGICRFV